MFPNGTKKERSARKRKDRLEMQCMENILKADVRAEKVFNKLTKIKIKRIYAKPRKTMLDLMIWHDSPIFVPVTSNVLRIEDILFFDGIHIPSVKSVFTQHGNLKPIENVRRPTGTVTGRPKLKRPEPNPIRLRPIPPPAKKKKPFATIDLNKLAAYAQTPAAVYGNMPSPYGIATQMLADQLKEDLERRTG